MEARQEQIKEFEQLMKSDRSEFVVLTGRRRIGKTYLVNELFGDRFSFYYTGGHHLPKKQQLHNFAAALGKYSKNTVIPELHNWFEAFYLLQNLLEKDRKRHKKVVFFDEMPWIDTPKSDFVAALENFWNSWAAQRKDILFIASGSATSWMADKLFNNKGGLHNRITHRMYLPPFTLRETENYLRSHGCKWDRYQLIQAYMVFGGVPFYLSLINVKESLAQNINNLFFKKKAQLRTEFDELYPALFSNSENYIQVVRCLAQHRDGLTRNEILAETKIQGNTLTIVLKNLCLCDFVIDNVQFAHTKQGTVYRLADFYTFFYLRFVENDKSRDEERWIHIMSLPQVMAWQGLTFELVWLTHLKQFRKGLGIDGMETDVSIWRGNGMQIDLIINRGDRLINLCEIKFSKEPYTVSKELADKIRLRAALFKESTKTRKGVINTFLTTFGVLPTIHSGVVDKEITMDCLFV